MTWHGSKDDKVGREDGTEGVLFCGMSVCALLVCVVI